jgi:hypothetical protein
MHQPWHSTGHLPIMPKMCATCPFGPDDRLKALDQLARSLNTQRICHSSHTRFDDNGPVFDQYPGTHICRGALQVQAGIMTAMGVLPEPTIAAWEVERKRAGFPDRKPCKCKLCLEAKVARGRDTEVSLEQDT